MNRPGGEERRVKTRELVDKLLNERQEMLVLFCRVAGLEPYTGVQADGPLLEEFCEILIDYTAAGHFGLYQRITEGRERRARVRELAESLYPHISETTDAAVDFNDRWSSTGTRGSEELLAGDLSALGQHLATRVELEDRLIEVVMPAERDRTVRPAD